MSSTKKLTLEERLAQAAKKGKKKGKKQTSSSPVRVEAPKETSTPEITGSENRYEKDIANEEPKIEVKEHASVDNEPVEKVEESKLDETEVTTESITLEKPDILMNIVKLDVPVLELKNLKLDWLPKEYRNTDIHTLFNIIDKKVSEILDSEKRANTNTNETLSKKEELIKQLRSEGENLAKTDLKKSNQIKLLKKKVFDLEKELSQITYQLNDETSNFETLEKNLNDLQQQVVSSNTIIKDLKLQIKDTEMLQDIINERDNENVALKEEIATVTKQLSDHKIKYDLEMETLKESTTLQIYTLETDLEQMRIKLENNEQSMVSVSSDSTKNNSHSDPSVNISNSGSPQYHILEQQLRSSKKNWKSIEDSLNVKIVHLEENMQTNEKELQLKANEVKKLTQEKINLGEELEVLKKKTESLVKLSENYMADIKALQNLYNDLRDDFHLLNNKYNIQKNQLAKLYKEPNMESPGSQYTSTPVVSKSRSLNNISEEWLLPADESLLSVQSISTNIGENKSDSGVTLPETHTNNSNIHVPLDIPDDAEHLQQMLSSANNTRSSLRLSVSNMIKKSDSSLTPSKFRTLSDTNNDNVDINSGAINSNPQLVTRLGSEVRRLENELRNMQRDQERISKDKEDADEEILKLLERNDKIVNTIEENKNLKRELETVSKRLEVSLQLLGEKTETVEELENDVNDLKDMIKQQVQQMVEMQDHN